MDSNSETRNQLLENPLQLIHDQFKQHISQLNFQTQTFNSQDLKIPQLVENILSIQDQSEPNLELIPSLNSCENVQDIQNLNGKLVKFECMIQDMYEEEYFMSVLLPLQTHDTNSTIDSSNSQNTQNPLAGSLLYKYYSNLTSEQMNTFDTQTIDQRFAQERGNLLGITVPNVNSWVKNQNSQEKPKSCLIKVYDDQVRGFKLNDSVTFIGILEVQKQAGGVRKLFNQQEQLKIIKKAISPYAIFQVISFRVPKIKINSKKCLFFYFILSQKQWNKFMNNFLLVSDFYNILYKYNIHQVNKIQQQINIFITFSVYQSQILFIIFCYMLFQNVRIITKQLNQQMGMKK